MLKAVEKLMRERAEEYHNMELGTHGVSEIVNSHARPIKFTAAEVAFMLDRLDTHLKANAEQLFGVDDFDESMDGDHESALESAYGPNE